MRLISLEEYNTHTMQLARPIYDKQKRILLAEGRSIHPAYLDKLRQLQIGYIFVEDAVSKGISMEEMLDMPTWLDAIAVVQQCHEAVANKNPIPLKILSQMAKKLIMEAGRREVLVLVPTTMLAVELRPFGHAVNVCLLTIMLGKKKYNQLQLKDLAEGALLHDIGKALTEDSAKHCIEGFDLIRKNREISLVVAHMAYQHNERYDGTGIPRGLKGNDIHEFAQICSIANDYDNMTSSGKYPPHEALEYIMTQSGVKYKEDLVHLFIESIPLYPPGTKVKLNKGETAIVTKVNGNMQRPTVKVLETEQEIDLNQHHTLLITEIVQDPLDQ